MLGKRVVRAVVVLAAKCTQAAILRAERSLEKTERRPDGKSKDQSQH